VIIAIVVLELIVSLIATVALGVGNPGSNVFIAPMGVWFTCAILQLAIHYRPRGLRVRNGLMLALMLMLLASIGLEGAQAPLYFNQWLFIAAVAALPQILLEWSSKAATGGRIIGLCLIGLVSLPLGLTAWSLANIGIVKIKAWFVAHGEPYCLLVSDGRIFTSGYRNAPDDWSLSGLRMFSGRGVGGSGDCCQWDFHALLLTQSDQLFNWSYRSQRFDRLSERSRQMLRLTNVRCG
jgi:hypothetical protein